MHSNSITMLSSRGRGISADMSLVHTHLNREFHSESLCFRFFAKNERGKNDVQKLGAARLHRSFMEAAENIICVDASLGGKIFHPEGKRLMIAAPYDYQFKNYLTMKKKGMNIHTLHKFTHIIPGCPFTEELIRGAYRLEDTQIIGNTALPVAWDVCQKKEQDSVREKIEYYYPEAARKKVLTFLISGSEKKAQSYWEAMDMKSFLKQFGDEWFVFTNSETMMENAHALKADCRGSFAYMNRLMQPHELLFLTDMLVTNNGRMAVYFAGRKKPVYCPLCGGTSFEKYMKVTFGNLCIPDSRRMAEILQDAENHTSDRREFSRRFYYENAENPYEKVAEVMDLAQTNK